MSLNKHYLYKTLSLVAITLFALLPFILHTTSFLNANNDLNNFFKPLIVYVKDTILVKGQIPLWNDLWFGGMPLVADPQSPISYPLNTLFLFGDINQVLILTILLHTFLAALFFYNFARELKLDVKASFLATFLYVASPRYFSALTAGHLGIIYIWTWIPLFLLSLYKLTKKFSSTNLTILAVSMAAMIVTHLPTAIIVVLFGSAAGFLLSKEKVLFVFRLGLASLIGIMLVSPFLLPNLVWQKDTTRNLLLKKPEIYPIWNGKIDLLKSLIFTSNTFDTEKAITVGLVPLILSIFAFRKVKKYKFMLLLVLFGVFVISASNVSPFKSLLLKINFFELLRVMTRFWIVISVVVPILCGFYIKNKKKNAFVFLFVLSTINVLFINFSIAKYLNPPKSLIDEKVYSEILNSNGRVYCDSQCLDPFILAKNNINSINGYATLIPNNFYIKSWGLFGGYWDYYTLALPPFGAARLQHLSPNLKALGEYNVDKIVEYKDGSTSVYKNPYNLGLAYNTNNGSEEPISLKIITNTPNLVRVDAHELRYPHIVLARGFSVGMKAYTDKGEELIVEENPSSLSSVKVTTKTSYIDFVYDPPYFKLGLRLLETAIILMLLILFLKSPRSKFSQRRSATPISKAS